MDYSKFYTPPEIATLLVDMLQISEPEKIVDICCGSCNLLYAAKKRWQKSTLHGVDIVELNSNEVFFKKMDGRDYALNHMKQFPLVLANPPFDFVSKKGEFPSIFQGPFENYSSKRLEIEMLIANLLLLSNGGTLAIILPSSFVEASSYTKIRKIIAEHYYIKDIIKLNDDTFGTSLIKSYALIIENNVKYNAVTEFYYTTQGKSKYELIHDRTISNEIMRSGDWIEKQNDNLNLVLDIKRGNISSAFFVKHGQRILHTSKLSDKWKPSIRHVSKKANPTVYVEKGDILVSRIGKSAGQWCQYQGDTLPISDCLYRIKDVDGALNKKLHGRIFDFPQKGVATRYITMKDFIQWINSINEE